MQNSSDHSTKVRHFFDERVAAYDAFYEEPTKFGRWFNRTFRKAVYLRRDHTATLAKQYGCRTVLDVGCHLGLFVMLAQEAGFACTGIDVSADAIKIGAEQLGIPSLSACTLDHAGFAPESFDGLVIWDVLEHLYDLTNVMQQCATVLKPDGYFFAQVPNHRGVTARLKTLACKLRIRRGRFHHFGFPWHLYHFSPRSLDVLVRRAGLETVRIRSYSHRSKSGAAQRGIPAWINQRIESLALSDYLYIVARKTGDVQTRAAAQ